MNLSEPFIRRPVMTILLMTSLLFFGAVAYRALPVSDLPNIDLPTIEVSVNYPGANPETMANAVATPLEQQFMTIEGIQTIFSSSNTSHTSIVLNFALGRNIDGASTDVASAISRALPQLPVNLPNNPTFQKVNPASTPILYFCITAPNMTLAKLYDYAYTFMGQRMSMVEGVSQVLVYGSPYAVRVQIDPEKLAAMGLGIDEVAASIQGGNVDLPLGTLNGNRDDLTISVDGQLMDASGYNRMIIKNQNGNLVRMNQVGRALDSVQDDKFFQFYLKGKQNDPCIVLGVQRLPGENTIRVANRIKQTLETLKPQLPQTLVIEPFYDQSESIVEGVKDVKITLFIAFILVVIIIYLFLGKFLNTVIPCLALPLSVLGTFSFMYLFGFSIDILSLLALTLSIGFLVDDAVVVLENSVRHVQKGATPLQASIEGAKEISTTVLSMTLCLAAALLPMLLMGGVIGKLFREFASTIIAAVLISGFVALTLTPMLTSRFVKPYDEKKRTKMERFSELAFEKMRNIYAPSLHWALNHRICMLLIGLGSVAASLLLAQLVPKDFLPPDDIGFIQGYTQARDGTSPYQMLRYHNEINKTLLDDPNIEALCSVSSYSNANEGVVFIRMKPYKDRLPLNKVIQELSPKLARLPGINTYLNPVPLINFQVGTTAQGLYQYSLTSLDRQALYDYAPKLLAKVRADRIFDQVSSDLRDHQPHWDLRILRDRASNYFVNAEKIEGLFTYGYSTNKISQINAAINQYQVILETLPDFYQDPTVLSQLYVRSSNNNLVPLSEIVEATESIAPLTINHVNGLSAVNLSFNIGEKTTLGTAVERLDKLVAQGKPPQVYGQIIGTADIFAQSFQSLTFLLVLAFFIIYVVLGILYESFIHPITVMSALPPALFGGLFTLFIFRQPLSIYSFVGLILLIGIVLKNGIMMVDFAIVAREKEKKSAYDAIVEASLIRFRPIMMTIAALMGAVPIALGIGGSIAQNRVSLGLCVVGGLVISQLLTLLLTPVLYYYFEVLQEKLFKK